MTKGRPFSIYCIILFLCTEARENNHILLQRGMYLSQKWSTAPFCPPVHRAARPYGLCVLYDTAARVSEICSLCIEDVRFESPPHIRIMGKGMKVCAVPILPATAKNEKNPQPMGNWLREIENILKTAGFILFFLKKIAPLPCQIPESGRKSGHQVGKTALKWLDNTVKPCSKIGWRNRRFSTLQQRKKTVTSFSSQSYGGDDQI